MESNEVTKKHGVGGVAEAPLRPGSAKHRCKPAPESDEEDAENPSKFHEYVQREAGSGGVLQAAFYITARYTITQVCSGDCSAAPEGNGKRTRGATQRIRKSSGRLQPSTDHCY